MTFNLRDKGATLWANANKWQRYLIAAFVIVIAFSLPVLEGTFFNTPSTPFVSVLFYPIGLYVLMALGLNVVVGKSGRARNCCSRVAQVHYLRISSHVCFR